MEALNNAFEDGLKITNKIAMLPIGLKKIIMLIALCHLVHLLGLTEQPFVLCTMYSTYKAVYVCNTNELHFMKKTLY